MKEKIVYVTNERDSAFELQEEFFQLGYEFFILTSIQIETEENISFLNFFDVVILRETKNNWITPSLIDKLNDSAIPTIIMSPYQLNVSHCQLIEIMQYPLSHFKLHATVYSVIDKERQEVNRPVELSVASEVFVDGNLVKDVFRAFPKKISMIVQPTKKKVIVPKEKNVAKLKNFEILLSDKTLYIDYQPIKLTNKEQMLMDLLIKAKYQPISNQYVFYQLWNQSYLPTHQPYIANLIKKIRQKVMHCFETELSIILNTRKKGYYLNPKFKIIK